MIDESLDVMLWALKRHDPQGWLDLTPEQEEQAKQWVNLLDGDFKFHLDRYKYSNRYENCDPQEHLAKCLDILQPWEQALTRHDYLLGAKPKYLDYAVLPFIRQFRIADPQLFDQEPRLAHIRGWLNRYLESDLFKAIMPKFKQWQPGDDLVLFPSAQP